jgi:transcription elongation factor GreA-like protein
MTDVAKTSDIAMEHDILRFIAEAIRQGLVRLDTNIRPHQSQNSDEYIVALRISGLAIMKMRHVANWHDTQKEIA